MSRPVNFSSLGVGNLKPVLTCLMLSAFFFCLDEALAENKLKILKVGSLIDVETGSLSKKQEILIKDDQILSLGAVTDPEIIEKAQVIDLSALTVLPGLIDVHVHLIGDSRIKGYRALADSIPKKTLFGALNAKKTLMAGFTTVRNVGAPGFADVALRDAIEEGVVDGPRMLVAGPSIGASGGHCDNNLLPQRFNSFSEGVADGPWKIREKVRQNIKYGADLIKFCATGGVLSKGTNLKAQQYAEEEMKALVEEAESRGRSVAAHAHGTRGIKTAIKSGVASIEHASFIDEEGIKLALERGTALVMDIYVSDYILEKGIDLGFLPESIEKERTVGKVQRDNFQKAHRAGANIVFGSDAGVFPHGLNANQFSYMVKFGMNPIEAIRAATLRAAKLIGWEDVGIIKPGMKADIIGTSVNPLEDISALENVNFVMKAGKIYRRD